MVVRWSRYFPAVSRSLHRFHDEGFSLQLLEDVLRGSKLKLIKFESRVSTAVGVHVRVWMVCAYRSRV